MEAAHVRSRRLVAVVGTALGSCILAAACDREVPKTAVAASAPHVEPAAAPPHFPIDAPYYPHARPDVTSRTDDGWIERVSSSPDSAEQVYAHITRSLFAQGWEIGSKRAEPGRFAIDASKGDRRVAVRIADHEIVGARDRSTRITVRVTP